MTDQIQRLARVEERVGMLTESNKRLEDALTRMANAVTDLAQIKIDHERHSTEITHLRQRVHSIVNDLAHIAVLENEIEYLKRDSGEAKVDINRIKLALPNIELSSGWVFKAALGVLGLLGTVAFGVIIWAISHGATVSNATKLGGVN